MVAPSSLPLCTPNPCSAIHTQTYTVYSRGMESGPSGFDPLSLCPSFPPPPSLPRPFYRPFRVLRDARPSPHPLKEDDRLEDTQAPANGFVLLASIGIKPPPPPRSTFRGNDEDDNDSLGEGEDKWTTRLRKRVTREERNKYKRIFRNEDWTRKEARLLRLLENCWVVVDSRFVKRGLQLTGGEDHRL